MKIKSKLIRIHWFLSIQLGIDPIRFIKAVFALPIYFRNYFTFRKRYSGRIKAVPCLHDRYEEGGQTHGEYFWQDLIVARAINEAKPVKHVDIGSRVDGFVAHIASFRDIEVFDVRSTSVVIPGVVFRQADLMELESLPITSSSAYCDSLSCLHTIEHFGLGRYGDPINPEGYKIGIKNMAQLLKNDGTLYLSTPIGKERVEFDANWIFDPKSIINCAKDSNLELKRLMVIKSSKVSEVNLFSEQVLDLAKSDYQLGIFFFKKNAV